MLQLDIPATEDTPKIVYTGETNEFNISGRSLPEDVTTFYRPVFEWLEQFANESKENTAFKFKIEYFNTASSKIILDILMQLEDIIESKQKNLKVELNGIILKQTMTCKKQGKNTKNWLTFPSS
jgi:hypothetical protein